MPLRSGGWHCRELSSSSRLNGRGVRTVVTPPQHVLGVAAPSLPTAIGRIWLPPYCRRLATSVLRLHRGKFFPAVFLFPAPYRGISSSDGLDRTHGAIRPGLSPCAQGTHKPSVYRRSVLAFGADARGPMVGRQGFEPCFDDYKSPGLTADLPSHIKGVCIAWGRDADSQ